MVEIKSSFTHLFNLILVMNKFQCIWAPLKQFFFWHIVWVISSLETNSNSHWYIWTVLLHISWIWHLKRRNFEANCYFITPLWYILWVSHLNNISKLGTIYASYATPKSIHLFYMFFNFPTITSIRPEQTNPTFSQKC